MRRLGPDEPDGLALVFIRNAVACLERLPAAQDEFGPHLGGDIGLNSPPFERRNRVDWRVHHHGDGDQRNAFRNVRALHVPGDGIVERLCALFAVVCPNQGGNGRIGREKPDDRSALEIVFQRAFDGDADDLFDGDCLGMALRPRPRSSRNSRSRIAFIRSSRFGKYL